jgi:CHAT domain-containing protein
LPATSAEVAGIARVYQARFPEGVVVSLTGPAATESALRQAAPNCRVLHLATHGFFDPTSQRFDFAAQSSARTGPRIDPFGGQRLVDFYPGLLSGIALAGANRPQVSAGQDDGVLTALEVAVLDLSQCDLAVLSACETGLGKAAGGEGLLGLQRAFQVANAKTVVASLWSVNDDATGLLITEFYRNLWERNLPKGESLRQAQLKMLRGGLRPDESTAKRPRGLKRPDAPQDYRKPYYWAAFELSGDSG